MRRFRLIAGSTALVLLLTLSISTPMTAYAEVAFVKSFDEALKQAAKEKKFIVLDISASW